MQNLSQDKKIILFDGLCNLCNTSVQFIIKYDKKNIFRFVSLQSQLGIEIKSYLGLDIQTLDTIIFYEPEIGNYTKSKAVFKIAKKLGGWFVLLLFFELLPSFLTDKIYDYIAKNRYKWFGKKEKCILPSQEMKNKQLQ